MRIFCIAAVAISMMLGAGQGALAHHAVGGSATSVAGPIRTISATPIEKGSFAITADAEHIDNKGFSDARLMRFAAGGKDAHNIDSVTHLSLGIGYGITENLSLGLRIPYVSIRNIREAHSDEPDEVHVHGNSKGIGDMTLLGKYTFLRSTADSIDVAALLGIKVPTGRTKVKDRGGERFEADHQPGSGSWDPMAGLAFTKHFGKIAFDANVLYILATEGAQDSDLGDVFLYNAALSYRLLTSPAVDAVIELNGEWKAKEKVSGVKDENSGGNLLLVSPGIRVGVGKNVSLYLSVGIPVAQDLNGIQNDERYRVMGGIGVNF